MAITLNDNLEIRAPKVIDTRLSVGATGDLISLDVNYNYSNMVVWIESIKSNYVLKNSAAGDSLSDWVPMLVSGGDATSTPGEGGTGDNYYG